MPRPPDQRAAGIATYILTLRNQLGMSIKLLSEQSGLSLSTVGDIERGNRSLTGRSARMMASPLGVTPNDLLMAASATLEFPWIEAAPSQNTTRNAIVFHVTSEEERDLKEYLESVRVRRWLIPIRRSMEVTTENQW